MLKAIYPGSFDPVTYGHIDIIERAAAMADSLVVGVLGNPGKRKSMFTVEERIYQLQEATKNIGNVEIMAFNGMLGDFARSVDAKVIIRGVRDSVDFQIEFQRALINKQLTGDVETIFLAASAEHIILSSSAVKEIAAFGGDISFLVPETVKKMVDKKCKKEMREKNG